MQLNHFAARSAFWRGTGLHGNIFLLARGTRRELAQEFRDLLLYKLIGHRGILFRRLFFCLNYIGKCRASMLEREAETREKPAATKQIMATFVQNTRKRHIRS
jgi:hypothetical protein